MSIKADFRFNRAGQGCFYTGIIKTVDDTYSFAYDCGTASKRSNLREDIDNFKLNINNSLDLLFISHFDSDHVNEVHRLLHDTTCDTLVIPYLFQQERMFLLAAYYYFRSPDEPVDDEYILFIRNPYAYFASEKFRIKKIVVIYDSHRRITQNDDYSSDITGNGGGRVSVKLDYSRELARTFSTYEGSELLERPLSPFVFCNCKGSISLGEVWSFSLFNFRQADTGISGLIAALKRRFKIQNSEINADHIRNVFEANISKQVRSAYRVIFGDVNSTSLVIYHEPLLIKKACICIDFENNVTDSGFHKVERRHHRCQNSGTLLTGNISIQRPYIKQIREYFRLGLRNTIVFQVPHHGSGRNWESTICTALNDDCIYVINYGLGNRFRHPSGVVVEELKDYNLALNNQIDRFSYLINIK